MAAQLNNGRKWTEAEDEAVKMMVGLGASDEDIARALKRTGKGVYEHRHTKGLLTKAELERSGAKGGDSQSEAQDGVSNVALTEFGNRLMNDVTGIGALVSIQREQLIALQSIADSLGTLAIASLEKGGSAKEEQGGQSQAPLA